MAARSARAASRRAAARASGCGRVVEDGGVRRQRLGQAAQGRGDDRATVAQGQDGAARGEDVAEGQHDRIGRAEDAREVRLGDALEAQPDARVGRGALLELAAEPARQRLAADEQPGVRPEVGLRR